MALPIAVLPKAKEDIREQLSYLSEFNGDLVESLTDAIEQTLSHIADFPESGKLRFYYHLRLKNIRQWPIKGFKKLLLFYQIDNASILIIRVLHTSRDIDGELLSG
jgi:toxin ParE1/3/4